MAQLATRINEEEKQKIEKYCEDRDIKISQLIRWALKEYMENHQEKE